MEFSIKSAIGTFSLIIVNVIVFMAFGFSYTPASQISTVQCVKQTYPQCLAVDSNYYEVAQCMKDNPGASDACMYGIRQECANNPQIEKACYPQALQTSQNLSFVPALFSQ